MSSAIFTRSWGRPDPTSIDYRVGRYLVKLGKPRVAYTGAPGENCWFAGMNKFPNGKICLRMNAIVDASIPPSVGDGTNIMSLDNGQTFDPATKYATYSSHTSAEPLAPLGNTFVGGCFSPREYTHPGGDKTKLQMNYYTLTDSGYTKVDGGCTVTGFPFAIEDIPNLTGVPNVSWFGAVVQIADNNWVSSILPTFASQSTRVWPQCIKSTDHGLTWTVIGQIQGDFDAEGMSEGTMVLLGDGRLKFYSRTGVGAIASCHSSDNGVTWSAAQKMTPWLKAPIVRALTGTADYAITTGYITTNYFWPGGTDPITGYVPPGYAPAQLGLYLSSDPDALSWPVVDLIRHHNTMMPNSLAFDGVNPSTGYTWPLELDPNHLLISYDQAGAAYGSSSRLNRVFVVDAWIGRVS